MPSVEKLTKTAPKKEKKPIVEKTEEKPFSRIIKDVVPKEFVETLEKWSDALSGYTAGEAPITFRFLTSKNSFAMIIASAQKENDTRISFGESYQSDNKYILEEIINKYGEACAKRDASVKASEAKIKEQEEKRKEDIVNYINSKKN